MEAVARSFSFISNEASVKIPFFQRGYVWKKDNWEDLLFDLKNLQKNHFLGSIILKQQRVKTGEPKEVSVIDGQQRLTTLSILVKALYDSFSSDLQENARDVIRQHLFFKKNRTDKNFLVKIQHSQVDAKSFNQIIKYKLDEEGPIPISVDDRILSCYHYFYTIFSHTSEEENELLFNYILDPENKIIVVIDLHQDDDEQAIFDTINSAGIRLSTSDIIKNALFQAVIKEVGTEDATDLYKNTWEKIFVGDHLLFWETQRATGRLYRDNLEILLHAIAVIKGFYDPENDTLSDLSRLYKAKIQSLSKFSELEGFIYEIKSYAEIYKDKILVFDYSTLYKYDNWEQRLFDILNTIEISTFHPFILFLYKSHANNPNELSKILNQLASFVLRRVVAKWETKSFNKLTKEFINNPSSLASRLKEIPESDFSNGLRNISNKIAGLILFWIELHRRHYDTKYGQNELKWSYTLEHIMPQKWQEYWSEIPIKVDTNGSIISENDSQTDRSQKIYWIGNMTLLTSSLNASLRNYEYKRKMEGDGKKKGIKAYAELSITNHDLVLHFDNGDYIWDESKIIKRTEQLEAEAVKIWAFE